MKKRYLDTIARLRKRGRKVSVGRRRLLIGAIVFLLLGSILMVELNPYGLFIEKGRPSPRDIVAPSSGDVLIRKGEVLTAEKVQTLERLGLKGPIVNPFSVLFALFFTLLLIAAVSMYLARFRKVFWDSPGLLLLLGGAILMFAVVAKLLAVASWAWSPYWGYLIPAAAIAIIIAVLYDGGTALVTVAICSLITGVVTVGNFSLVAFTMLAGFFPSLYAGRTSTRHQLRRVGLYTAFWVALAAFGATGLAPIRYGLFVNSGIGFLNGAVCAVIAMGALPFLETTFRVTTNMWLLELASPEQDLLRELAMAAPGTYSHSMMVANLCEAAARAVGSDPLLARVAAYYHDVGKTRRPQFFIENQSREYNPHDNLSPNLSTLIIISHVKDGVEMLEANHIPPDLIEIVRQHHGTSLVRYFYESALDSDAEEVDESWFRYHLQKPRRRTAGILMLADAVEATARTMAGPSPAAIGQMVDRIVKEKIDDGQLDECDLTYGEMKLVRDAFKKALVGTHHPRVDYPTAEREVRADGRKGRRAARGRRR